MRVTIRQGVFETNSSSTHATVYIGKYDHDRWIRNNLYLRIPGELDKYTDKEVFDPEFVTEDEAIDLVIKSNEELTYYMGDADEKDYPDKLREMISKDKYRPFVEVGLIPYEVKDLSKDSGIVIFDDCKEYDQKRIVDLDFMV